MCVNASKSNGVGRDAFLRIAIFFFFFLLPTRRARDPFSLMRERFSRARTRWNWNGAPVRARFLRRFCVKNITVVSKAPRRAVETDRQIW